MTANRLDLHLEPLENRRLLAGNVNVVLTPDGDLVVTGDNHSNRILIEQTGLNELRITPEDAMGASDNTSINGGAPGDSITIGFGGLRDLKINMRGGHDHVVVRSGPPTILVPLTFRDGIVNGGAGSDLLLLGDSLFNPADPPSTRFVGSLTGVLGGSAAVNHFDVFEGQLFSLQRVEVGQDLLVRGGAGSDAVHSNLATVHGQSTLRSGAREDGVMLFESTFGGPLLIHTGARGDLLGLHGSNFAGPVSIHTGSGGDLVFAAGSPSTFDGPVSLNTGSGGDLMSFHDTTANSSFTITTGGGNDHIFSAEFTANGDFTVNTGGGRDRFYAETFWASGLFTANGGGGRDEFGIETFNHAQEPVIQSFEEDADPFP